MRISKQLLKYYHLTEEDYKNWLKKNNILQSYATSKDRERFFKEEGRVK